MPKNVKPVKFLSKNSVKIKAMRILKGNFQILENVKFTKNV